MNQIKLFFHHRFFDQCFSVGRGGKIQKKKKTCWAPKMTRTFFSGPNNDHAPARQMTRTFFSGRNNDRAPTRQTTRIFFPVVITITHPPDRRLELFFLPVVIMIVQPPDRRLYLFFFGCNNDRAPARQMTRTFFFRS